jgi:hypothetical protein
MRRMWRASEQRKDNLLGKVGIVTPYRAQLNLLKSYLLTDRFKKLKDWVEIKSVRPCVCGSSAVSSFCRACALAPSVSPLSARNV